MSTTSEQVGFELSFWIAPWNRDEFLQTATSLAIVNSDRPGGSQDCFENVGAESWFLWRECWDSPTELTERLQSSSVKTLLGAIEVLGKLDRMQAMTLSNQAGPSTWGAQ